MDCGDKAQARIGRVGEATYRLEKESNENWTDKIAEGIGQTGETEGIDVRYEGRERRIEPRGKEGQRVMVKG